MRVSLLPSLLQVVVLNRNRGRAHIRFFEISRVYMAAADRDGLAAEPSKIAAVGTDVDLFFLKSVVDRLVSGAGAPAPTYVRGQGPLFHPGRTSTVKVGEAVVGTLGEIHPAVLAEFDLSGRATAFELDSEAILSLRAPRPTLSLPRFPAIERDLAVVVAEEVAAAALLETIRTAAGDLLTSLTAFDEYRSDAIGAGRRSIAFALTFRSPDRTLTDSEVDQSMELIRRRLEAGHGARGR